MSTHINILTKQSAHSGFTLIEILVTMVIMSGGLLGLAGLQATALRDNIGATLRTQAVLYANDIAERMRANPTAVTDNEFWDVTSLNSTNPNTTTINCAQRPNPYCGEHLNPNGNMVSGANCNARQLAKFELNTWFCGSALVVSNPGNRINGVNTQLPQASFAISCSDNNLIDGDDCSPNSLHTISVSWRTLRAKDTDFDDDIDNDNTTQDCLSADDDATECQLVALVIRP